MKIAYFGFNAISSCLDLLIHQENHEIVVIYTGEEGEHTDQIIQLANANGISVKANKPTAKELEHDIEQGIECFICAEYPHKIPISSFLKYSINIHPTLLPEGRGQTPLPHLILKYPQYAGVTLHKMTNKLDQGDIILSKPIGISDNETFDSLHAKVFLEAPMLLQQVLNDLDNHYSNAKPQSEGTYWSKISIEQQAINWQMKTQDIALVVRAFGSLGVKFSLNNSEYYMTSAQCVTFSHAYQTGDVIIFDQFKLIIALSDGLIIIPRDCLFEL